MGQTLNTDNMYQASSWGVVQLITAGLFCYGMTAFHDSWAHDGEFFKEFFMEYDEQVFLRLIFGAGWGVGFVAGSLSYLALRNLAYAFLLRYAKVPEPDDQTPNPTVNQAHAKFTAAMQAACSICKCVILSGLSGLCVAVVWSACALQKFCVDPLEELAVGISREGMNETCPFAATVRAPTKEDLNFDNLHGPLALAIGYMLVPSVLLVGLSSGGSIMQGLFGLSSACEAGIAVRTSRERMLP